MPTSPGSIAWMSLGASIAMGSSAQVTLKHSTNRLAQVTERLRVLPWLVLWGAQFAGAMLFWMIALSRLDISIAYPLMSLGYVAVTAMAMVLLGEKVSNLRWFAVGLITCGAAMVAGSV